MKRTSLQRGTKQFTRRQSLQASSSLSRSPVKGRSRKRSDETVLYGLARALYLAGHPTCERCHSEPSEIVHHKRGRGIYLADPAYFMAVSDECHRRIHANPEASYALGHLIKRNQRSAA